MNSFQQPVATEPSMGTLHMLAEADITNGWDITDGTISDTWENGDFSDSVPEGTKGIYGFFVIYSTSLLDTTVLCVRPEGGSHSAIRSELLWVAAERGAAGLRGGLPLSVVAPNGQFEYRRYSSGYPISQFYFRLLGYYL